MNSETLINTYLQFFINKGHTQIKHAPLATKADSSTLFNSAGMQPLIPYLSGQPHPAGKRLVNFQPCLRTNDIDEVGDTTHLTFFEMLGNWSLGDYFKAESIEMSLEFLTQHLHIDPDRLWVTVFGGDAVTPADTESPRIWQSLGFPAAQIVPLGRGDNWWGPVGETGPCGPDTEIFFQTDQPACGPDCQPGCSCGHFIEIWNNVFMSYYRTSDGRYEPLPQKNVDTGMGVDRTIAVLQGHQTVFETDLFVPLMTELERLSPEYDKAVTSRRIIADHLKAATLLLGEGIKPANKGQGYILRRLIRRAVDHGRRLNLADDFGQNLAAIVIDMYERRYPYLQQRRPAILTALQVEAQSFHKMLARGRRIFDRLVEQMMQDGQGNLPGQDVFHLFDTYGIPIELTAEWSAQADLTIDRAGFEQALEAHREISGGTSGRAFAGGLVSHDPQTTRLHTATHLLHQALRDVLGSHVAQKGSHITPERLRFDFSHPAPVTPEQLTEVEQLVNSKIKADLPVHWSEMTPEAAKSQGATGLFDEKYGERVKVYDIGTYSREICGGPHVENTGQLGKFHILREQSNGAGVRRIRATLEA